MENMNKNAIDAEEYPATTDIQNRCVNMIGRLFNAPTAPGQECLGVSTVGSSEAIILATLAMKRKWQQARRAAGKPCDSPNIIMSSGVQVCWEKAARYLDIEERYVYCTRERYVLDVNEAA
jgi:glutamate decarboxylase